MKSERQEYFERVAHVTEKLSEAFGGGGPDYAHLIGDTKGCSFLSGRLEGYYSYWLWVLWYHPGLVSLGAL